MSHDPTQLNYLANLGYLDPDTVLKRLRSIELDLIASHTEDRIRRLRTNGLKPPREMRLAALFCLGMTALSGSKIWFADVEDQDYDFVAMWRAGEVANYCPVQLKEIVPHDLNPDASIHDVFESLRRYSDPSELVVAVSLSQKVRFDPATLDIPEDLNLGQLWVFGTLTPDHSKWALWGDFTKGPVQHGNVFDYPAAEIE